MWESLVENIALRNRMRLCGFLNRAPPREINVQIAVGQANRSEAPCRATQGGSLRKSQGLEQLTIS